MNSHPKWKVCPIDEDNRESESSRGPKQERSSLGRFEAKAWKTVVGYLGKTDIITLGLFLCQESAKFGFQTSSLKWFVAGYFELSLATTFLGSQDEEQDRVGLEGRILEAFVSAEGGLDSTQMENLMRDIYEVEMKSNLMFEQLPKTVADKSFPHLLLGFFLGKFDLGKILLRCSLT